MRPGCMREAGIEAIGATRPRAGLAGTPPALPAARYPLELGRGDISAGVAVGGECPQGDRVQQHHGFRGLPGGGDDRAGKRSGHRPALFRERLAEVCDPGFPSPAIGSGLNMRWHV